MLEGIQIGIRFLGVSVMGTLASDPFPHVLGRLLNFLLCEQQRADSVPAKASPMCLGTTVAASESFFCFPSAPVLPCLIPPCRSDFWKYCLF